MDPDTTSVYTLARTHQPRPPSPLITFAPDSPPFSPISLTTTPSPLDMDLSATLKPLPGRPIPQTTAPAPLIRPPLYIDYLAIDPTRKVTHFLDLDLEAGGHNIFGNERLLATGDGMVEEHGQFVDEFDGAATSVGWGEEDNLMDWDWGSD
ncbi:MAG: hypothetical protein Q9182_004585 [Xanthomendoza sp. 2 TL-2023]